MDAENGQPDLALAVIPAKLRAHPYDFSFYQAVRLLQRLHGTRLGAFSHPSREPVRLSAHVSLAFPPAEIRTLEPQPTGPPRMEVNFFGLIGPLGVMPTRHTEYVLERVKAGDYSLRDFLDIFNHRFTSLLYRAWERYRYPVAYERGDDPFTGYLLHLIGLGQGLRNRQAVPDQALICFEGLLAQFPRSVSGLRQMLSSYFEVPVEVIPFAGAWRKLDRGSLTQLQGTRTPGEQLGIGMVVGDEVWDQQTVVRVRLGPMSLRQYRGFLPDGDAHQPLKAMCRFYCGEDLDVEAQLVLRREETPRFGLDIDGVEPPRIGWVSWMMTQTLDYDPDQTVLRLWE